MRPRKGKRYLAGGVFAVTIVSSCHRMGRRRAQARHAGKGGLPRRSTLVLVPVTVVDRRGAMVNGLASDAFTLTEDGERQPIRSFSEEDAPVSMGIVLDLSGSMKGVLPRPKNLYGRC